MRNKTDVIDVKIKYIYLQFNLQKKPFQIESLMFIVWKEGSQTVSK